MDLFDVEPLADFHPEIGLLLAGLDESTRDWRQNLGDVSVEAIVWQPTSDAYSVGGLLLHLIDVEDFWFRNFAGRSERTEEESVIFLSQQTDQYGGTWPVPHAEPIEWYYDLHDRTRARAREVLKGIDPTEQFQRPARNRSYTLRWVVTHVLGHDSYTGGQAVAMHELWKKLR